MCHADNKPPGNVAFGSEGSLMGEIGDHVVDNTFPPKGLCDALDSYMSSLKK